MLAAALAVSAPVFGAPPVYDDHALVERNPLAHAPVQWRAIFATGYWSGSGIREGNEYRPLTILSFAALDPLGVAGQRVANGVLHALAACLAGEVIALLFVSSWIGAAAGLAFAVHPVHAEVLGSLVGRGELLAAGLGFGAWWAHLARRPRLAALAMGAAFLAKETAIAIPALVLLGDLARGAWRARFPGWLRLLVGLALAMAVRTVAVGGLTATEAIDPNDNPLAALPVESRMLSALASFGSAARLVLVPVGLMPDRVTEATIVRGLSDPRWIPGLAIVLLAPCLLAAVACGKPRAASFALAAGVFVVAYLPVSNLIFPVGTPLAERLLYVPSLGACLALATVLERSPIAARGVASLVVMGVLAAGSVAAIWPYRDELVLWQREYRLAPSNRKALVNLASSLTERKRLDEAVLLLRSGIARDPTHEPFHHALSGALAEQGKTAEAIAEAREALRLAPTDHQAMLELAGLLYDTGDEAEAEPLYRTVAGAFPGDGEPWWYLSRIAEHAGDRAGAAASMREAAMRYGAGSEWSHRAAAELARLGSAAR